MNRFDDAQIIRSWHSNVQPWVAAVRDERIESRRLVTNAAIVDAVASCAPAALLDVGCGEGWLLRALAGAIARGVGVDVVPALIDAANTAGGGEFHVVAYERLAAFDFGTAFDAVVCNFSLIGKDSVEALFAALPRLLAARGRVFIQTLHPLIACGDAPYRDGWREGSWAGFSADFKDPAPWYFRTLESWITLFDDAGLRLLELREPLHPHTHKPASVIFIAQLDE